MTERTTFYFAIIAMALLTVTSPASSAKVIVEGPTASLEFLKGYDKGVALGAGSAQRYRQFKDDSCKKTKHLASFSWATGPSKIVNLPADKLLRIEARTDRYTGTQSAYCENFFSFTPKAGRTYKITQQAIINMGCNSDIVDAETNQPPEDLERFDRAQCVRNLEKLRSL